MSDSILTSTKKALGLAASNTDFDDELIMHINSVLATLNQLGVGPDAGLAIADASSVWSDLIETDLLLNNVRSYVSLKVKQLFDPPSTSFQLNAIQDQVRELEFRINLYYETTVTVTTT